MSYFVYFVFILFVFPACLTQTCEKVHKTSGEIHQNAYNTQTKCWTLKVPENSYIRVNVKEVKFHGRDCKYVNVKLEDTGSKRTYTYCSQDIVGIPITALSDVNITYFNSYNGLTSSFRLHFTIESLICGQNNHFRCSPDKCIHQFQVCNGVKECENGADEVGCDTILVKGISAVKGMNESREGAVNWLRKQRSASFGWGKNTHRAITALYLAKAVDFTGENLEEELMVKQLELQTLVALLRNSTDPISVSELSMFVNALKVTCHNSRKFYGHDLLQILGERASTADPPSPSAYLTLCNSNWTFTQSDITRVFKFLQKHSKYPFISDVQAVALMAISCMKKEEHHFRSVDRKSLYDETIKKFISAQLPDGSFGNVYTTAIVTQALISSEQEDNKQWNVTATAQYLMKQLNSPSVDFLSTYLTLPIFSGRSLIDISTVNCSNITRKQGDDSEISEVTNKLGGKMLVQYSLYVGDQKDVIHTLFLRMPENSTAYDVMRVAQVADPKYKFSQRDVSGQMYVYDIAGITSDPEAGMFWLLYVQDRYENGTLHHYTESPDKLVLSDSEHLIMWYKTATIWKTFF